MKHLGTPFPQRLKSKYLERKAALGKAGTLCPAGNLVRFSLFTIYRLLEGLKTRSATDQRAADADYHHQPPPRLHFKMSITRNTTSWEWEEWAERQDGERRWGGRGPR